MANEKNLKPWKKGVSGNLEGRPALPEEVRTLRNLGKEKVKHVIDLAFDKNMTEVKKIVDDPSTPSLIACIGKAILEAHKNGDFKTIDLLLDRTIGKPKETIEVSMPRPTIIQRRNGDQIILGAEKDKEE